MVGTMSVGKGKKTMGCGKWRRPQRQEQGGFSLAEMLVAGGVMVVLGFGVIAILSNSIQVWQTHETARDAYDRASAVLFAIENDLVNMATSVAREPLYEANQPPRARLLIGYDLLGRPYLVFTKHLKDDMGNAVTRNSGRVGTLGGAAEFLVPNAPAFNLRAIGNLEEVAYGFGPAPRFRVFTRTGREIEGEWLEGVALEAFGVDSRQFANGAYIGTRELVPNSPDVVSPRPPDLIGFGFYRGSIAPPPRQFLDFPTASLFRDFDWARQQDYLAAADADGLAGWQREFIPSWLEKFQLLGDGVLYVGYQITTATGATFFPNEFDQFDPFDPDRSDCYFDSAIGYDPVNNVPGMGFPSTIRVTVTVEALNGKPTRGELTRPFTTTDTEIHVSNLAGLPSPDGAYPVVLIGDGRDAYEWVRFESVSGRTLRSIHRGIRGTPVPARDYPAGTIVRWGLTLTKTIQLRPTSAMPTTPVPPGHPRPIGPQGWSPTEQSGHRLGQ